MIVDASALLSILLAETDAPIFAAILAGGGHKRLSVVGYVEVAIRIDRLDPRGGVDLDAFLTDAGIVLESVTLDQARIARAAHARFGKARHRARLNMGDCFAYALAIDRREPLLFKGDDFQHTDVARVL
ncbi:MAG: type II toxin-antitoxin system VapC family toxin [Pseudomonadota bacterium]